MPKRKGVSAVTNEPMDELNDEELESIKKLVDYGSDSGEEQAAMDEQEQTEEILPAGENPDATAPESAQESAQPEEETVPDEAALAKKKRKKLVRKITYFALLAVFIGVFIFSAVYIVNYMVDSHQNSSSYNDLANRVNALKNNNNSGSSDSTLPSNQGSMSNGGEEGNADESKILEEYRELYALNNDLVGWITVPDTKIDYPVMQSPNKTDYYLNHNFYGKYSSFGCIYARESCDVFTPCDNIVLYGHHMKDGSMFAGLDNYKKKSFWEEHQYFTFDTLYEHHTYQVIAVFKTSANKGKGFSYHLFNTANSEEEFNEFIKTVHSLQMYKTGVTAEYGDMLLTLSTCEYTLDNGRFVVVAKRVS